MFVETTWKAILAEIAKVPIEKANIKLRKKVIGVKTSDREEGSKVVVTTDDGEHLEYDEIVMTTPLGWLKSNQDIFEPALSQPLLAGINSISVGNLEKVHLFQPALTVN
jgi:hypothetical protein